VIVILVGQVNLTQIIRALANPTNLERVKPRNGLAVIVIQDQDLDTALAQILIQDQDLDPALAQILILIGAVAVTVPAIHAQIPVQAQDHVQAQVQIVNGGALRNQTKVVQTVIQAMIQTAVVNQADQVDPVEVVKLPDVEMYLVDGQEEILEPTSIFIVEISKINLLEKIKSNVKTRNPLIKIIRKRILDEREVTADADVEGKNENECDIYNIITSKLNQSF